MPNTMRLLAQSLILTLGFLGYNCVSSSELPTSSSPSPNAFPLVTNYNVTQINYSVGESEVIQLAARTLANDIKLVTGKMPAFNVLADDHTIAKVYIASIHNKQLIEDLKNHVSSDELQHLSTQWESFLIKTISNPEPDVDFGLLILGSDSRGTAYGVFELSQAIGVSPWYWWADVPVKQRKEIYIQTGIHLFGPPSVKYRGIFINDEDWGLHPWARTTFDPELGDIGPKTYERVFELLLRLKANTLWPAMHHVSGAFNKYPENKKLADQYGIIMGSSHAEPMLRNNVIEWMRPESEYNYLTHKKQVLEYWETRVRENREFENIYTLGMRGIHDSGITAGKSKQSKAALLGDIIQDQRRLLSRNISSRLDEIPQAFTPYKEVLELYRTGINLPDDVTLVWPDDNHGYIRQFPNEQERARSGGSGVYYHLSYLGSPLSYLWLYTTPPALMWEELHKAYALGAQHYWIANVGDVKPAEMGIEFFLQMAWDVERWTPNAQNEFINTWAAREFGDPYATDIVEVFTLYFELNFQRRPEHLQWWLPHTRVNSSPLTEAEIRQRLSQFQEMSSRCLQIKSLLPERFHTAYFELVEYPVLASHYANMRYFHLEQYDRFFHDEHKQAVAHGNLAHEADEKLRGLTYKYNNEIANGKWRGIMNVEPADNLWRSYRQTPLVLPAKNLLVLNQELIAEKSLKFKGSEETSSQKIAVTIEAEDYTSSHANSGFEWKTIQGLGRSKNAVGVFPIQLLQLAPQDILDKSPYLEYRFPVDKSGKFRIEFKVLPGYSITGDKHLKLAFGLENQMPRIISVIRDTESDNWKQEVLSGEVTMQDTINFRKSGNQRLRVYMVEPGVIVDQILIYNTD